MIKLRPFAALSVVLNTGRIILCGGVITLFLVFGMSQEVYASENQEQVVVSPAQQAVNNALSTATTEVQQAISASTSATSVIQTALTEYQEASSSVSDIAPAISVTQDKVNAVATLATQISTEVSDPQSSITSESELIQNSTIVTTTASNALINLNTEITQAQTEITQATTARTAAVTAVTTAQTELTQANIAIDNAQTAINNLQATIGTTTTVLENIDDAGVQMNLPFGLLMGGTLYNNVFVGSNATITFGTNEGWIYYQTPNAPSISIAGWDWTTWSTGTGITYSTTESTLDIAWDVRPFPQTDASTQMVQIRFNADVNPVNGAWRADVSAVGPIPSQARFNYRETTGGAITQITDTNSGSGFNGQIGQGPTFTPIVNSNIASVQAAIDAANATIFQLNSNLSPVVLINSSNQSLLNSVPTTAQLNTTVNNAITTKNNLITTLTNNITALNNAIDLVPEPQPSSQPQPEPVFVEVPDSQPEPLEPPVEIDPDVPVEEEQPSDQESETEPEQDSEDVLEPAPEPELTDDDSQEPPTESITDVEDALSDALEDGVITSEEKEVIVEALLESSNGDAITAEAIKDAGLEYSDLPPETPVEVRRDENGNQVIITAEVASALQLLESPAKLISGIFSCITPKDVTEELTEEQKCEVLAALANIGADMSPEEREEATKMVVATVIASGAALNAVGAAAATRTGGSTGGGAPSGGNSGGASESKGVRRRRET